MGGAEKLLLDIAKFTDAEASGVKLSVVLMNNIIDDYMKNELLKLVDKVHFFNRKKGYKHPKYLFKLIKIVKDNNIQVVHTHSFGGKFWAIGMKLLCPRLKIFYTVHMTTEVKNYSFFNKLFHKRFVNKSIAISNSVYDECMEAGITKTVRIYNGIDLDAFGAAVKDFTIRPFKLVSIARIVPEIKGQDVIIKAVELCCKKGLDVEIHFAGDIGNIYENDANALRALAQEGQISGRLFLDGLITDTRSYLRDFCVYVCASTFEGLGLSIIEGMASGIPSIVTDIDGPKEIVHEGENGLLFAPGDYKALAEHIERLYNEPGYCAALAANARESVGEFDIRRMLKSYTEEYETALKG